jgi:hypothetical protein
MGSLKIISSPYQAFGELTEHPRCWQHFLVVLTGFLGAGLAIRPFARQATSLQLLHFLSSEELEGALTYLDKWFVIGTALSPLFLLVKFGFYTALAWSLGSVMGLRMEPKRTLAVVISSSVVTVLESYCIVLILWLRGLDSIQGIADLEVALGLNLLIPSSDGAVFSLLGNFNPFEIWFVILLALGLTRVHSLPGSKATTIAFLTWSTGVFIQFSVQFALLQSKAVFF